MMNGEELSKIADQTTNELLDTVDAMCNKFEQALVVYRGTDEYKEIETSIKNLKTTAVIQSHTIKQLYKYLDPQRIFQALMSNCQSPDDIEAICNKLKEFNEENEK